MTNWIVTKGYGSGLIVSRGYGAAVAAAVDEALGITFRGGRLPVIKHYEKRKQEEPEECDNYIITVSLEQVNDKIIYSIKDQIVACVEKDEELKVVVDDVSVTNDSTKLDQVIIEVKCLTPKQPKKYG